MILLVFICGTSIGQSYRRGASTVPLNPDSPSMVTGTDVIIHDDATQDQRKVCLAVAPGGIMYAFYTVTQGSNMRWEIRRSANNGVDWYLQQYTTLALNWYVVSIDAVVTETVPEGIRLFVAVIARNDITGYCDLKATKYDMNGSVVDHLYDISVVLPECFRDVSLASDFLYPATGASPYSIGMLYSKSTSAIDSIVFLSSSNGGASFDGKKIILTTLNHTRDVSLSYGRSPSYPQGKYFAAWEERLDDLADLGEIWTAHTYPNFNSDFTTPLRIDNMIGASDNFCKNPVIACQNNNLDNSSGNLTEVILFDRAYNGNITNYDVVGLFNKEATNTDNWLITSVDGNISNTTSETDLKFYTGNNYFITTYFDATTSKLRCLAQGMEIPAPYSWDVVSDQYNDNTNLIAPYPRLGFNPVVNDVALVWNAEGTGGKGIAMFDEVEITVGIRPPVVAGSLNLQVFPNPANAWILKSRRLSGLNW
jgi:hypothetical protein